jgi:hypothetical protein
MDDPALSVFSEARNEYMKQLTQYIRQPFLNFFLEQLQVARDEMRETPKKYLWQFQNRLKSIKEWNIDKVQHEITRIQMTSNCDFLEELITAVFIAHTKVMTAIRISSRKSKVNITVPKLEHYLFKAICESSDLLWANAFLFRDDISPIEKQKNMRQVEGLVIEGMQQAIRCLLPVKSILRDLVAEDEEEAGGDAEEEELNVEEAKEDEKHLETSTHKKEIPEIETNSAETDSISEELHSSMAAMKVENTSPEIEETRHFDNKKEDAPSNVTIHKLPAMESDIPMEMPVNDIKEVPFVLPVSADAVLPQPSHEQEPPIFQVDTSKKVQFSEYNMGFKDEDEPSAYFESMDDGLIILDDKEEILGDNDFDSL